MFSEDYILRMIQMATAAMARIFGLRTAGRYTEALQAIDQALEQLLGLRAGLIKNLDDSSLLASLTAGEELDTDRLYLVADLIKEEGDVYAARQDARESSLSYLRALNFYLEVALNGGAAELPPPNEKIAALVETLSNQPLPVETLLALFTYYEEAGEYARVEQTLSRLVQKPEIREQALIELSDYYRRLLEKPEAELAAGGLSRSGIKASLAKLPK